MERMNRSELAAISGKKSFNTLFLNVFRFFFNRLMSSGLCSTALREKPHPVNSRKTGFDQACHGLAWQKRRAASPIARSHAPSPVLAEPKKRGQLLGRSLENREMGGVPIVEITVLNERQTEFVSHESDVPQDGLALDMEFFSQARTVRPTSIQDRRVDFIDPYQRAPGDADPLMRISHQACNIMGNAAHKWILAPL
jgi:hypothetical protein